MFHPRRAALCLALAAALCGFRQESTVADKIIDEGRTRPEVMAHLDHLTNKIGPRLTSSDRLTKACEWAKAQFEKWGLKNCRLEEWGTFPVGFNRGPSSGLIIPGDHKEEALTFITNSWTPGTDGPVRGPAVMGPSTEEQLEAVIPKLKGAWVLSPGAATSKDLNEKILAAYDKEGIAGLIRSGRGELILTGGNHRIDWEKLPKRVNITLLKKHFDRIKESLAKDEPLKLEFNIKNEFKKGPIPLYNVLAEIPGTEKPEELVIVGGTSIRGTAPRGRRTTGPGP